jgi:hypothetical protein
MSEVCGLFSIARLPGVTTKILEVRNTPRIVMMTTNNAELKDLRRIARQQVWSLTRNAPKR